MPRSGLFVIEIQRGVGDVDGAVVRLHARPLFDLPSGSFCSSKTTDHDVGALLNTVVL